ESVPAEGARLTLRAGPIEHQAEILRPATGAPEIAVAPGVTELRVESSAPLLVRVRVRQHRAGPTPGLPKREVAPASPRLVKLDRLRLLAREARKLESEAALSRLRTRRANLLLRLGYRTLAETDAARRAPGSAPIGVG